MRGGRVKGKKRKKKEKEETCSTFPKKVKGQKKKKEKKNVTLGWIYYWSKGWELHIEFTRETNINCHIKIFFFFLIDKEREKKKRNCRDIYIW